MVPSATRAAADYNGPDSFTYRAFDGQDYSNAATVRITVTAAQPPTEVATFGFAFRLGSGSGDSGAAIASDAAGNVYVVGLSGGSIDFDPSGGTTNLSGDVFIAKYTATGSLVWARSLSGNFGYEGRGYLRRRQRLRLRDRRF